MHSLNVRLESADLIKAPRALWTLEPFDSIVNLVDMQVQLGRVVHVLLTEPALDRLSLLMHACHVIAKLPFGSKLLGTVRARNSPRFSMNMKLMGPQGGRGSKGLGTNVTQKLGRIIVCVHVSSQAWSMLKSFVTLVTSIRPVSAVHFLHVDLEVR